MVILKKIVIMTEYGKSNCSGIVKFENFAGRTSCFVRILGVKVGGVICIKCGEDIVYCGDLFEGEKRFNALYDLNKSLQIAVLYEGSVVSLGSNRGRFIPTAIVNDIHRYLAHLGGAVEQSIAYRPVERNIEREEPVAAQNVKAETLAAEIEETDHEQTVSATAEQESVSIADERTEKENEGAQVIADNTQNREAAASDEAKTANAKKEIKSQAVVAQQANAVAVKKENPPKPVEEKEPFFKKIEANMQELFDKYDKDEELCLLIPDSKWARVPTEGDGYYVVGMIYSEDTPNVICYGVPDKDASNPPQSSENCRQWMEIEKGGRGYWMMYQSADTGETLTDGNGVTDRV